ncbi:reverse transcriptase domain-containing protein [Tanacetum coccineum]|uniref:Reverse transcriptase domain-containing protein n=1 Tax=Tanacetum coccineum TaxID=301880 RepID=A0ABQ5AHL9_9ASTR
MISKRRNRRCSKQIVKPEIRTIVETPVVTMADTRTMSELLQAPIEGYEDAIVIPAILAKKFELKVGLLQLVTLSQFHGFERDDPHAHIRWGAGIWLEKEPPHSILTWEDLDQFKELLRKCPQHGFSELHQIDTFYNALTQSDQDSLNAAAGGNLLNRTPRDALTIIKNKSKVRTSRNKPIVSKVSTTTSSSSLSPDVTALAEMVNELVLMNKANQQASVKAVDEICVTCGGPHPYYECLAIDSNTFNAYAATGTYNQGGPGYRPQGDPNYRPSNQMGPLSFPLNVQNNQNCNRYNQNQGNYQAPNNQRRGQNFNQRNNNYQALNFQDPVGPSNELTNYMKSNKATLRAMQTQMTNMKTELRNEFKSSLDTRTNKIENKQPINTIANLRGDVKAITTRSGVAYDGPMIPPTPSTLPKEVECETEATKDKVQTINLGSTAHVQPPVVQIPIPEPEVAAKPNPKQLHINISFADALLYMPKFASTFKSLLSNKEKLFELANTPLNENCSAVLLKQLLEKLGDPDKFLISCDFQELDECLALADLGASINLMPLSVWKKLSLPELTPTRMTLELVNRSVAHPKGVSEDVFVKVGKFYFLADFVVFDEWQSQPSIQSIASYFPSFTPFEGGDFILEAIEACLSSDSILPRIDDADFDPGGDIRLLEKLLNNDPSSPLPPKELNFEELKMIKSSIDDPPELELKDLPSHLEYAFLEGTDKLPL